ncbi:hypothetical protein DB35_13485 [Streptomyces abyssalis]|uniref:A-factor biosynthesis hotdog domain-containing protein n=1 Tax=Streptomyces abyssalis TaxID=933944 RepID=A0A1E7JIP8_9ACTN|nr:hypothetical protein AN215_24500 [Streptomyces abyssalis]OEU93323.1 hypothetical protein DB35_13485 [Streptomyces abyssalis]
MAANSAQTSCRCATAPPPGLTTTVPREYVHRASVTEVLLTGWTTLKDGRCAMTAQWPRSHSFFTPIGRTFYDSLLAAETIRQVGALLAHTSFDVPLDRKFLMWDLNYLALPDRLAIGSAPANLEIDVTCTDIQRRRNELAGLRYETSIRLGGQVVASGGAGYSCVSPKVYDRLRAAQLSRAAGSPPAPLAPVAPASVGRGSDFDVVLAPSGTPGSWQVRLEPMHPVLFDHPVDHIPGMALLEAARQAVHASDPGPRPALITSIDSSFQRYAEFGRPCWIEATRDSEDPGGWTRVTGRQDDETVFTAAVLAQPLPLAGSR